MMPPLVSRALAPPFELSGTDGKTYRLATALKQAPVLAAFFKVSCPTCQFTFPYIERLYQQFRGSGVQFWGISQDNSRESQRFAQQYGVTFPILIDDEPYAISQEYGLTHVPSLFLIGSDGLVELSSEGFSKSDLLSIQKSLATHFSVSPPLLFTPKEKIPEYKPG